MTAGVPGPDESVATRGARWLAVGMVAVGLSNYGYAVLLTHLLTVAGYSRFAAGQGLLQWATGVATVAVPWVLAQALVRARTDRERTAATRFAKLLGAGSGILAAVVVGAIATRFAGPLTAAVIAVSVLVLFLGTATTGWLQGNERMTALSGLFVLENVLKNGAGVLLVAVAGLGDVGALGAFGIGGIAMLLWWPRTPRGDRESRRTALGTRDLWRRAVAIAGAQALVSLFVSVDVVLVALLPGARTLVASYQASATLSRIPLYVAAAVAAAFFPTLSRGDPGGAVAARAVQMYTAVALPLGVVLATVPTPVLTTVFPAQYAAAAPLLKWTAVIGLAAGGISLATAFFQAVNDYSCLWWLGAGLAGYVGGLLVGWRVDGITGLAAGGALGAAGALVLVGYRLARRQGSAVLARPALVGPAVAAAVLVPVRPYPWLWLAAASAVGLYAAARFLRPGALPRGSARRSPGRHRQDRRKRAERWTAMRETRRSVATGRVVVVMPTYQERPNLEQVADRLHTSAPDVDLLVVDDNSPDGTGDLADKLAEADPRTHVLHRCEKAGLGPAYLAGFRWALQRNYDVVVEMDADGSHQPEQLPKLMAALGDADVVIGSRWVPGGETVNWPKSREVLSRCANLYTRWMLGLAARDATGGYRAYRAAALEKLHLASVQSTGYCFQIDLTRRVAKAGLRLVEVPITFVERERGASKMTFPIMGEAFVRVTRWGLTARL